MLPPRPPLIISLAAAWLQRNIVLRFWRMTASKPLGEMSTAGAKKTPPALFTMTVDTSPGAHHTLHQLVHLLRFAHVRFDVQGLFP